MSQPQEEQGMMESGDIDGTLSEDPESIMSYLDPDTPDSSGTSSFSTPTNMPLGSSQSGVVGRKKEKEHQKNFFEQKIVPVIRAMQDNEAERMPNAEPLRLPGYAHLIPHIPKKGGPGLGRAKKICQGKYPDDGGAAGTSGAAQTDGIFIGHDVTKKDEQTAYTEEGEAELYRAKQGGAVVPFLMPDGKKVIRKEASYEDDDEKKLGWKMHKYFVMGDERFKKKAWVGHIQQYEPLHDDDSMLVAAAGDVPAEEAQDATAQVDAEVQKKFNEGSISFKTLSKGMLKLPKFKGKMKQFNKIYQELVEQMWSKIENIEMEGAEAHGQASATKTSADAKGAASTKTKPNEAETQSGACDAHGQASGGALAEGATIGGKKRESTKRKVKEAETESCASSSRMKRARRGGN